MPRPVGKGEAGRAGQHLLRPLRQVIGPGPSQGSLTWNATAARHPGGIIARVLARVLALAAAIWHNDKPGQEVKRPLIAYDH